MTFTVVGGSGGSPSLGGGYMNVAVGDVYTLAPGGQGQDTGIAVQPGIGGTSLYAGGGSAGNGGAGGAGASALYKGTLAQAAQGIIVPIVISSGGGGGSVFASGGITVSVINGRSIDGNGDESGVSRGVGSAAPYRAAAYGGTQGSVSRGVGPGGQVNGTFDNGLNIVSGSILVTSGGGGGSSEQQRYREWYHHDQGQ